MLDDGVTLCYKGPTVLSSRAQGELPADRVRQLQGGIRANMGERWVCWDRATRCPRPCVGCGSGGGASGVSSRGGAG